jgi:hypothetical protein
VGLAKNEEIYIDVEELETGLRGELFEYGGNVEPQSILGGLLD